MVQEIKIEKRDLVKMYKAKSKDEIIEMLINCNSIIENLTADKNITYYTREDWANCQNTSGNKFLLCDCGAEALLLTRYDDEDRIYLAIYTIGQFNPKPSIWERLKYCWYHLTTGKKYEDQVILNREKTNELIKFLQRC